MPIKNARKKASFKKPRTRRTKRKATLRRVKKIKRTRSKSWYRKWKGKSASYKFKKAQGIKWSTWLSLPEFLLLPHESWIHPVIYNAASGDTPRPSAPGSERSFTSTYNQQCKNTLGDLLAIYSTEVMNQAKVRQLTDQQVAKLRWTAWNPVLSRQTLGPLFNAMLNMYKYVKFCGVKVSYKPNVKLNPSMLHRLQWVDKPIWVTTGNTSATATTTTVLSSENKEITEDVPFPVNYQLTALQKIKPPSEFSLDESFNYQWINPPVFRLWVNFDKQGYESRGLYCEQMIFQSSAASANYTIQDHRLKQRNLFNSSGMPNHSMTGLVKSFPLNKPFKFYVRPKMVSKMFEAPSNETVLSNWEASGSSYQQDLLKAIPNSNEAQTSLKPAPYMSINNLYPINHPWFLGPQPIASISGDQENNFYVLQNIDQAFYDPILFSTFVTLDNMRYDQVQVPYSIYDTNTHSGYDSLRPFDYYINPTQFLNSVGKFKVTFYAKFKGIKQMAFDISADKAIINGTGQLDTYTLGMEEEILN